MEVWKGREDGGIKKRVFGKWNVKLQFDTTSITDTADGGGGYPQVDCLSVNHSKKFLLHRTHLRFLGPGLLQDLACSLQKHLTGRNVLKDGGS